MFGTIHPDDYSPSDFEPYNAFATADQERHYLHAAGFLSGPCDCSRCEWAAELEGEIAESAALFDASPADEIERIAADMFDRAERDRAAEFAPDPFAGLPDPPF